MKHSACRARAGRLLRRRHTGDLGSLHLWKALDQSIIMAQVGARKDHRKGSNQRLKASNRPTASQLRRSPKPHQTCSVAHQSFQISSIGHGQQKPLNLVAQFDRKAARFEAPIFKNFGHLHCLFIGKTEHPKALCRLAQAP